MPLPIEITYHNEVLMNWQNTIQHQINRQSCVYASKVNNKHHETTFILHEKKMYLKQNPTPRDF